MTSTRRGVAAVEFAVCLPVLTFLVFGSIELSNGVYTKQAATAAAYEAARVATAAGGSESVARARVDEVLQGLNITGATVTITPAIDDSLARGTVVTLSVAIPSELNSGGLNFVMPNRQITSTVSMVKQ
ncbi:TadE family protein [Rubripirellula tenax]|nr:TadE family protein [Rubripirellula tenax]